MKHKANYCWITVAGPVAGWMELESAARMLDAISATVLRLERKFGPLPGITIEADGRIIQRRPRMK